jgi:hypothetical protein
MAKGPLEFRRTVRVFRVTQSPHMHHPTQNPWVGWSWNTCSGQSAGPFAKLEEAKAAAESFLGKVDWKPSREGRHRRRGDVVGNFGPRYGPDEWLELRAAERKGDRDAEF